MSNRTKAVSEELFIAANNALKESGKDGEIGRKMQAIISAKKYGITAVSKIFGVSRRTIMNWIHRFENEGINGFNVKSNSGRKPLITSDIMSDVKGFVQQNPNITCTKLMEFIKDNHGLSVSWSVANRALHSLNFSYITPRPKHYKASAEAQEEFKKN